MTGADFKRCFDRLKRIAHAGGAVIMIVDVPPGGVGRDRPSACFDPSSSTIYVSGILPDSEFKLFVIAHEIGHVRDLKQNPRHRMIYAKAMRMYKELIAAEVAIADIPSLIGDVVIMIEENACDAAEMILFEAGIDIPRASIVTFRENGLQAFRDSFLGSRLPFTHDEQPDEEPATAL